MMDEMDIHDVHQILRVLFPGGGGGGRFQFTATSRRNPCQVTTWPMKHELKQQHDSHGGKNF